MDTKSSEKPLETIEVLSGHPLINDKNRWGAVYSSHRYNGQPIEYCWSGDRQIFIISSREIETFPSGSWKPKNCVILGRIDFNEGVSREDKAKMATQLASRITTLPGVTKSNVTHVSAKTPGTHSP